MAMRSIWAVAKNTIAQAMRMKIAVVIFLLLLVLLPLMVMITEGDGSLKGKLQTFMSYGLSLMSIMLCMLTIAISCFTLCNDIKFKHIFLVVTKPVRRFQILVGKFIGLVIIEIFLITIFAAIIYAGTMFIPRLSKASDAEIAMVNSQFFTARRELSVSIDRELLEKRADQRYQELARVNELPEGMSKDKILRELLNQEMMKERAVEVGQRKDWIFENVPQLEEGEMIFVQYKYEVASEPVSGKVASQWAVGDNRQEKLSPGERKTHVYSLEQNDKTRIQYEFGVPADCISADGHVAVMFRNPPINGTTVMPEGIKLMYRSGTFGANYVRAVLVILSRLIFLAALGVSLSTWLSFPVAIFISVVFFFIGTFYGFIFESLGAMSLNANVFYALTIKPLLWLLPQFDRDHNPTQYIIFAKLLTNGFLAQLYIFTVLIKSFVMLLLGMLIFRHREIARITA
jgi:hypothetical protein